MYRAIIGMEIHLQPNTKSKMFCACANDPEVLEPNTHICPICTGQPGALPVPNSAVIAAAVKLGMALNCTILNESKFDRKHYFYPDLPKGYQISQYEEPICLNGSITIPLFLEQAGRTQMTIGITRIHAEEDTAKLSHDSAGSTFVDFNRSGVPLLELVTNPDFETGTEAKVFCQELRTLLRTLRISDADMEKGQMRCEANISVQKEGTFEIINGEVKAIDAHVLNPKIEVKNLNSFKSVERAIDFEIERQTALIEKGETWGPETRGWSDETQETVLQRTKEAAKDYRYFPEPDIPPFNPHTIAGNISLPELPLNTRIRFHEEYGFSYADAEILTREPAASQYAEAVMSELVTWLAALPEVSNDTDEILTEKKNTIARLAGSFLTTKLMGVLAERSMTLKTLKISPENMAELIALIYAKRINLTNALKVLEQMVDSGTDADPTHIMEEQNYGQISNTDLINQYVTQVINQYPEQVAEFKAGKEPLIKFLIGMVMKASEGAADAQVVEELLRDQLK